MSVPSIRFARSQVRAFAERLLACARDASAALGFRPQADAATAARRKT
jgi:hypothetical protein